MLGGKGLQSFIVQNEMICTFDSACIFYIQMDTMKTKYFFVLLLSCFFTFFACGQLKWTKDISITAQNDGGMRPQSNYIQITDTNCVYIYSRYPKRDTFQFSLSKTDKDSLLKNMNKAGLQNMHSQKRKGIIYDYPGTSISLSARGKTHSASVSATEELSENMSDKFFALYDYILELAVRKTKMSAN